MPITVNHAFTSPVADGTNTQIVRPSDWNSAHVFTLNLSGSEVSQVFTNAGGVSWGLSTNGYVSATVKTDYLTNLRVSAGTTSNLLSAITFSNSNGITFGINASTLTASHNGLTTAAQSDHSHGSPALNLTNLSGTTASNSAGFTLSLSAAAPGAGGSVNFSAGTTSNNLQSVTFANSNGVSFGLNGSTMTASHNGLTTAMASNRGTDFVQATAAFAGTNASGTIASNGVSVSVGNYITTARASTDAAGLNTAQTNATWTVNSSGISLNAAGYAGTATTFNGANVSGSITLNSNGLQLSLSAPTPGGGAAVNVSAGTTSNNLQTIQFGNANNVSFGLDGSTVTASISTRPPTSYFANVPIVVNTTTLTVGQSTSHIAPLVIHENISFNVIRMLQSGAILAASTTAATTGNTTFSCGYTKSHNFVIYSRGVGNSSQSLQSYFSTQVTEAYSNNIACAANSTQFSYTNRYTLPHSTGFIGFTHDYSSSAASINVNSASATMLTALKQLEFPCATTLSAGMWYLMYGQSSSTQTQVAGTTIGLRNAVTYNIVGVSQNTLQFGTLGAATTNTLGMQPGIGSFTTGGAAGTTNSLGFTAITTTAANNLPYYQLLAIT